MFSGSWRSSIDPYFDRLSPSQLQTLLHQVDNYIHSGQFHHLLAKAEETRLVSGQTTFLIAQKKIPLKRVAQPTTPTRYKAKPKKKEDTMDQVKSTLTRWFK